MLNWKNVFKSWYGVPVLILAVLAVLWFLPTFKEWRIQRAYDKVEEPYYTDTYGGSTPEETYDLFIEALKAGDIELASRYFVLEKQDDWGKTLEEYSRQNILTNFVDELEENKKNWTKVESNEETFVQYDLPSTVIKEQTAIDHNGQKLDLPAGSYANFIQFKKYPSEVWKIALL